MLQGRDVEGTGCCRDERDVAGMKVTKVKKVTKDKWSENKIMVSRHNYIIIIHMYIYCVYDKTIAHLSLASLHTTKLKTKSKILGGGGAHTS